MPHSSWRKLDWLILALLAVGVSLFHARGLWPGYVFLPLDNVNNNLPWRAGPFQLGHLQNQLITDPIYQFYPFLDHAIETVRQGEWPLWHSQLLLGHPLAGDPLAQTFYPVFLGLGLAFGAARGLTLGFWLHAVLAACLTYGWLRALHCHPAAAMFGAFTYALGGYMVTWFETTFWVSTLSWLPGVLWAFELSVQQRRLRYTALAALMFGLATLAGQFNFVLMFGIFFGWYALGRAMMVTPILRVQLWPLASFGIVGGLGALMGALQLLPAVELLNQSHRAAGGFSRLPWPQIITWVVPNFYGNPATTGAYWGVYNFSEATLYMGVAALLLALIAPLGARPFWAAYIFLLAIGVVYITFGGPGVQAATRLPVLKYSAGHRTVFLMPLLVALLAGLALNEGRVKLRYAISAVIALSAIIIWALAANWGNVREHFANLHRPLILTAIWLGAALALIIAREYASNWRAWLNWGLVGLAFIDLYLFGSRFNPALPESDLPPPTPAIEYLQSRSAPYRVAAKQTSGDIIFGPNFLSTYDVADLSGYSSLLPKDLRQLVYVGDPQSLNYNANTIWFGQPSLRLLDLLQARYVVSHEPLADPGLRIEIAAYECAGRTPEITLAQPATGAFTARRSAINRLDLVFRVDERLAATGALTVRMWQDVERSRLVLESGVDRGQLHDQQPMTFFFAPETDAPGQNYVWEITTDAAHTGVYLCTQANGTPAVSVYGADWAQVYTGEVYIAERLAPLPRAYVVYAVETIHDETQAISRLLDESFDLRNYAIVADTLSLPNQTERLANRAEIERYSETEIAIRAITDQPGLLVLGDAYYPGWQAFVDGQPVEVLRANLIWRAVTLPAGEHFVVFRFMPSSVQNGFWLSVLGFAGIVLLLFVEHLPYTHHRTTQPPK